MCLEMHIQGVHLFIDRDREVNCPSTKLKVLESTAWHSSLISFSALASGYLGYVLSEWTVKREPSISFSLFPLPQSAVTINFAANPVFQESVFVKCRKILAQ